MKEVTMSFKQFFEMERGNLSLDEIAKENNLETIAERILKNDRLKKFTITTIALMNMSTVVYASDNTRALTSIITIPVLIEIMGAICVINCVIEILKSVINKKSINTDIILKYIMAFVGSCSIPFAFKLIQILL